MKLTFLAPVAGLMALTLATVGLRMGSEDLWQRTLSDVENRRDVIARLTPPISPHKRPPHVSLPDDEAECQSRVQYAPPEMQMMNWEGLTESHELETILSTLREGAEPLGIALYWSQVSPGVFRHLHGLERLRTLNLFGSEITDEHLRNLGHLPNLEALDLSHTAVTPAGLLQLRTCRKLRYLMVTGMQVPFDENVLKAIARTWPGLQDLGLEKNPIPPGGFGSLAELKCLRSLNLSRTRVTDADLRSIAGLPHLQTLHINTTRITDRGMLHLGRITSLEKLDLNSTRISDDGLAALHRLRNLRQIYFVNTDITDTGLEHLAALKSLRIVGKSWHNTPDGMVRLREALPAVREP